MSTITMREPAMIFGQRMHQLDAATWLITRTELEHMGWVLDRPDVIENIRTSAANWGVHISMWVNDDVLYVKEGDK